MTDFKFSFDEILAAWYPTHQAFLDLPAAPAARRRHFEQQVSGAARKVRRGRIAIANGSRKAVGDIERAFGDILLIRLAVDPGVLRERLRGRGRETRAEIDQRIERSATISRAAFEHPNQIAETMSRKSAYGANCMRLITPPVSDTKTRSSNSAILGA